MLLMFNKGVITVVLKEESEVKELEVIRSRRRILTVKTNV